MSRARRPSPGVARYAAPLAFLLGITIAVLLVRSGLGGGGPTPTTGPVTQSSTAPVPPKSRTVTRAQTSTTQTSVAGAEYATIQTGDTFGSIASTHGTTVDELMALNPGVSSNELQVGQQIRVK